jgi:hypothetical protein
VEVFAAAVIAVSITKLSESEGDQANQNFAPYLFDGPMVF